VRALQVSAVLTLLALGLMVWSFAQPTPLPVMLAMTVGQLFGTIAFSIYLWVVVRDVRRAWKAKQR
jgi:peptidoglycan/LPS O-acetylase OafA/YrhL